MMSLAIFGSNGCGRVDDAVPLATKYRVPNARKWYPAAAVDRASVDGNEQYGAAGSSHPHYDGGADQTTFRDYLLLGDARKAILLGGFYTGAGYPLYARTYRPFSLRDFWTSQGWGLSSPNAEELSAATVNAVAACTYSSGKIFAGQTSGLPAVANTRASLFTDISYATMTEAAWGDAPGFTIGASSLVSSFPMNGTVTSAASTPDNRVYYAYLASASGAPRITKAYDPSTGTFGAGPEYQLQGAAKEIRLLGDGLGVTALWRGDAPFKAVKIGSGGQHTCAVLQDGAVSCWGDDTQAQSSTAGGAPASPPVKVPAPYAPLAMDVETLCGGSMHSCALLQSGAVYCWGRNDSGQLGIGSLNSPGTGLVGSLAGAVAIACAEGNHSCAITSTGAVQCWGDNTGMQVGVAVGANFSSPQPAAGIDGLTADDSQSSADNAAIDIATGALHSCAVMATGKVKCWGSNASGQVGVVGAVTFDAGQVAVGIDGSDASKIAVKIAAGNGHTCALMKTGAVKCWGLNTSGQLGDGTLVNPGAGTATTPISSGAIGITAGTSHSCALLNTGEVKCWGDNAKGQIGTNAIAITVESPDYVYFSPEGGHLRGVTELAAGGNHTCAIAGAAGYVRCWGENSSGQLGINSTADASVPQLAHLSCAADSGCALMSSRSIDGGFYDVSVVSEQGMQVQSFGAAADRKGNIVVIFIQEMDPTPACSAATSPATVKCQYRVYASVRNANGVWTGPTRLDSQFMASVTSVYQQSAAGPAATAVGGKDYFSPAVTYLREDENKNSKFLVVYAMISNSTQVSGIYSTRYVEGSGWEAASRTVALEQVTTLDQNTAKRQNRNANELHLAGDGNGLALLSVHYRLDMNRSGGTKGAFGFRVYRYEDSKGWFNPAYMVANACVSTFTSPSGCDRGMPMGHVFPGGEAIVVFPAPTSAGGTKYRLYSSEYRE